jgi:hypothetical protein
LPVKSSILARQQSHQYNQGVRIVHR